MSTTSGSSGLKRREFLKVLGATGAAASAVGCSSDSVERLIPYLNHPDQTVPGVSNYYATTCRECAAGCGVIAEVRDGRAIKLEGNPAHPLNQGALCSKGQAALQGLYNPDRFRGPMMREGEWLVPITWDRAIQELTARLDEAGSALANAVFINQHESGSFPVVLDQWLASRGIPAHISYDADLNLGTIAAHRQAYGVAWPTLDFTQARLVVSFGADFLDDWGAVVPQQLNFADARAQLQNAPRFIYIGARRSLTGLNADEWIACRPGAELALAQALSAAVGGGGSGSLEAAAQLAGVEPAQLQGLVAELRGAGRSMILAGTRGTDATDVALVAASMNQALGNVGVTVLPGQPATAFEGAASYADVRSVVQRMAAGQVPVFIVRGANPVFTTPPALGFADAMARVPVRISFSSYPDETTMLCDLVLPDHHALESWGDAQPVPGLIGLQQPTMDPVFNTRPTADLLLTLLGDGATAPLAISGATSPAVEVPGAGAVGSQVVPGDVSRAAVVATSREHRYRGWLINRLPGGAAALTAALPVGLIPGSVAQTPAPVRSAPSPAPVVPLIGQTEGDFFFHVYPSPLLGTGSGANKPWLQELADPVSKIAWQTWIEIHPTRAWDMGIDNGDEITITTSAGSVTAPAYLYLGIQPDTVAMPLGRGHTAYGRYAENIGVNPLIAVPAAEDASSGGLAYTVTRCRVTKAAGFQDLVTTEGSARQHGRGIAQAMTVAELMQPPADDHGGHDIPGVPSYEPLPGLRSPVAADAQGELADPTSKDRGMYDPNHWSNMAARRWAMTIDLARCTGCSACVTACYAENNIPTVGAPWQGRATSPLTWDERPGANIVKGREMTWIRIERYFEGGEDYGTDFETRFAPMLCQHCGNAPCEPVCPVYATYHSPDGLNVQVYNRCVGTRYCSNNCPYKVRYFNWFGYGEPDRRQYAFPEPLNWQLNPDVTVRGKGVMEKCTFCVQRIREAEHRAVAEGRPVEADEFTTACAQACPSRAITFGDAADATWSVAQLATDRRAYHVFGDLSTFTAVVYLKSIIHPGPATPVQA